MVFRVICSIVQHWGGLQFSQYVRQYWVGDQCHVRVNVASRQTLSLFFSNLHTANIMGKARQNRDCLLLSSRCESDAAL
jgi:hypothetical protein